MAAGAATPRSASASTAIVFARLDPILKRLLEGLTSLKALLPALSIADRDKCEDGGYKTGNENENSSFEAGFVRLVKSLAKELESLSRGMRLESEQQHLQRLQHAKALCLLAKYVTLPLTAVFHLPLRDIYALDPDPVKHGSSSNHKNTPQEHPPAPREQTLKIRRSYVHQLYRLAAIAIRTFIEETSITTQTSRENHPHAGGRHNLLQTNTWIEYMVALLQSMPTYSETTSRPKTLPSPSSQNKSLSSLSLDDGSDAWIAILEAAKTLLSCFWCDTSNRGGDDPNSNSNSNSNSTTVLLVEAWHGTLSMRLVDCLTAFLATGKHRFSPRVHCTALETLFSLLQITAFETATETAKGSNAHAPPSSSVAFWRSVFPGVFAALYPRITGNDVIRFEVSPSSPSSTTPSKVQIQQLSLESLIVLLRVTLSPACPTRPPSDGVDDNPTKADPLPASADSSSHNTDNNANDDLLARLTSMAVTANHNNSNNSNINSNSNKERNEENEENTPPRVNTKNKNDHNREHEEQQLFFDRVRKRVEGPLIFLLRQLSVSSSDAIRREVVVLCRVILFETSHCWESTSASDTAPTYAASSTATPASTTTTASPSSEILMVQIPLELCIGFQQDPDPSVRASVKEIIDTYVEIRHGDTLSPSQSSLSSPSVWMVPRIVELIQKLSALLHRGDINIGNSTNVIRSSSTAATITTAMELRTELNLLAGYMQCLETTSSTSTTTTTIFSSPYNNKTKNRNKVITKKEIRAINSSMCNAIISSKHLRRGLIQLFDVDLDSLTGKNGNLVSLVVDFKSNSPIKLRYLDHPDLLHLARDSILRSLGRLLGPKYGAIFVDEIISDFIEASFQRPKANINFSSNDLFWGWLHEWIGSLVVAREILMGPFTIADGFMATTSTSTTIAQREITKKEKRRNRILLSLASSILPLLVDSSLWNLSIENRFASMKSTIAKNNETTLSPQALQRNQIVVVLLMELIGIFCQLLRGDLKDVIVSVFYPIVEKTTRRGPKTSGDIIQQTGMSTLKIMSSSLGLQSTEDLIDAEQNRLIGALLGRLRLPDGSRIPKSRDDAEEILSVAKTLIWAMEMINRRIANKTKNNRQSTKEGIFENDSKDTKNSALLELIALLDYRLDHLFLQKVLVDGDVETVCSLHKAFYNYFLLLFEVKSEVTYSFQMKNLEVDSKQPWLDLLSQFRKIPLDTHEEDDGDGDGDDDDSNENEGMLLDVSKGDIELFAKLIARDCYLLSYPKLESRISSCDALTMSFKFLAFVGSEHDDPTDDRNVIRNTILRQVSDSWPSIQARMKTLSEVILNSNSERRSLLVLILNQSSSNAQRGNSKHEDIGTQRIFLSKLFELIATMCECSGDFFADRFRNDVWPVMARHLKSLLEELQRQREAHSPSPSRVDKVQHTSPAIVSRNHPLLLQTTGSTVSQLQSHSSVLAKITHTPLPLSNRTRLSSSFQMSDTQRQLIVSILKCLDRILQQNECGKKVETLFGSIGFTLLPLLDIEDQTKIQELSLDCIRNILRIDSDVLRRPLMELSGMRMPSCPLKFGKDANLRPSGEKASLVRVTDNSSLSISAGSNTIVGRCHELLAFADSLPEQAIS